MVRDDDLLTDELAEALGRAAEPLSGPARAQIRTRIMRQARSDARGRLFMLASHRVAAAATAIAMLGGGVAYAAERSLPGDPLYGLKIAAENAAVSILPPGKLENRVLVNIAARRADETARMAREGSKPEAIDDALGELRKAVRQAAPTDGALGEEEAQRIRERGSDAPAQTREAIDAAVAAPTEPTAPGGAGPGSGDSGNQPGNGGGVPSPNDVDEGTGSDGTGMSPGDTDGSDASTSTGGTDRDGQSAITPRTVYGSSALEPSCETSTGPRTR